MKKPVILFFVAFLFCIHAKGQEKIRRYIQLQDYLDYSYDEFRKINQYLYQMALTGNIESYPTNELLKAYNLQGVQKVGLDCIEIHYKKSNEPEVYSFKDTIQCDPFDFLNIKSRLVFDKAIRQKPDFRKNVSVAIFVDSALRKSPLFYLSYPDFMSKLKPEESAFLTNYLAIYNSVNLNDGDIVIDSSAIARYALTMYDIALKKMMEAPKIKGMHMYINDSLTRQFTPEIWANTTNSFKKSGQTLDSDATMGFSFLESPGIDERGHVISTLAVGIWAHLMLYKTYLPNVCVFYLPAGEAFMLFGLSSNSTTGFAFQFLMNVSRYQIVHRLSEDYRH